MLAVMSFHIVHRPWRLSAVSREASRSAPELLWRKTVQWSRPTVEGVCGGRNRAARRCRCTRVSGWDVESRRAPAQSSGVRSRLATRDQLSRATAHRSRGGKRGMSGMPAVGDCRRCGTGRGRPTGRPTAVIVYATISLPGRCIHTSTAVTRYDTHRWYTPRPLSVSLARDGRG